MPKPLVIVESPAKAKTIAGFLGGDFTVESSIGHIRDLPRNAADVPPAYKGESWARLGVDVDHDFKPLYVVSREKRDQVRKLKALLKGASELYLATDEDREGESIAWHLLEVLAPRVPVRRMVFHEITRPAIERAVRESRDLDRRLVDAQETRRILDRLYGYEVSPVLWKKIMPALSAGRVQSVATRLLVERERARMRFVNASWWDVAGTFVAEGKGDTPFSATLVALDGRRLVSGRDFGEDGSLTATATDAVRLDEDAARSLVTRLEGADFSVRSVEERPWRRSPAAPFMTSTLQQEAGRKLRFSSARTMRVAQELYESGYITYMRTDSTTLSSEALTAARAQAAELYGPSYVPARPRQYNKRVKNAQEAHEAIRPAGDTFRTPAETGLSGDARRLYELVWMRTVASQMADATGQSLQVRLGATAAPAAGGGGSAVGGDGRAAGGGDGRAAGGGGGGGRVAGGGGGRVAGGGLGGGALDVEMATSGRTITFPGFLRAYVEGSDDPDAELGDREVRLPVLLVGDPLEATSLEASGHETQPPARYTEASLVKALEDLGVGRPSTYASIIDTVQARGYVWKKGTALVPSWTAFAVIGLLEQHFARLVDYGFTAAMEEDLDEIARGEEQSVPWLSHFYFGNGAGGAAGNGSVAAGPSGPGGSSGSGSRAGADSGGAGPGSGAAVADSGGAGPAGADSGGADSGGAGPAGAGPGSGVAVAGSGGPSGPGSRAAVADAAGSSGVGAAVASRGAALVDVGQGDGAFGTGLKRMVSENLGEIDAREINSIVLGADPHGQLVVVRVGRYGPYVQRGEERASVPEDLAPDELTVARALELLEAGSSDRQIGEHPHSGLPILLRAGRFGPYVQVGEADQVEGKPQTASLLRTMDPATVTLEDALRVLSLPRVVGTDPGSGEDIVATNGRYGPYIKRGSDSRSLASEGELFTVDLPGALAIFAQPKTRRGQVSAAPLRELGTDPTSGAPIVLKDGRFGPYVTDGVTNASLRKGDTVDAITPERAAELLADRRAAGPATGRRGAAKRAGVAKKVGAAKKAGVAKRAGTAATTGGAVAKKAGAAAKAGGAAGKRAGVAAKKAGVSKGAGTAAKAGGAATKKAGVAKRAAGGVGKAGTAPVAPGGRA